MLERRGAGGDGWVAGGLQGLLRGIKTPLNWNWRRLVVAEDAGDVLWTHYHDDVIFDRTDSMRI